VNQNPALIDETDSVHQFSWDGRWGSLFSFWEVALLFAAVMGSIYAGIATATKAAAFGALLPTLMVLRHPNI
jgi:TRAP-type mannitol/chloroaromatic compound transport system permease large subunit|tara:strand:+ start:386 stop:601 length:216 start_codon:yes stop_codon:yes gene_type:complete